MAWKSTKGSARKAKRKQESAPRKMYESLLGLVCLGSIAGHKDEVSIPYGGNHCGGFLIPRGNLCSNRNKAKQYHAGREQDPRSQGW